MSELVDKIRKLHPVGSKGIREVLYQKGTFKKFPFWFSLVISIAIPAFLIIFSPSKSFRYLHDSTELILSFFPNLLGFSLGGYALVVGFSNLDLIKAWTTTKKHSVYQILNAIFAMCIFLQVLTTLLSFILNWIIKVNVFELTTLKVGLIGDLTNCFFLVILIFSSIYSLLLTPNVVINLFTLSQVNNSYLTIQKLRDDSRNKDKKEPTSEENIKS